jgi:hypothetical protein
LNNDLNTQLDRAFRGAVEARDKAELLKQLERMDPLGTAALIVKVIPEQRMRTQEEIAASFGVDFSDAAGLNPNCSGEATRET